jgi:hypothetical protein
VVDDLRLQKRLWSIREAAQLVVDCGGSLIGEHGDGQAKAEFLPIMFGEELMEALRAFKRIRDPQESAAGAAPPWRCRRREMPARLASKRDTPTCSAAWTLASARPRVSWKCPHQKRSPAIVRACSKRRLTEPGSA